MKLFIIVPAYNEEEIIVDSARKLVEYLSSLQKKGIVDLGSRIVFVNDGSQDKTRVLLDELCAQNKSLIAIHFSRNYGHQAAVMAGYDYALNKCDACISIDADLQQDINAIQLFLDKFQKGNDIVFGVRNDREADGFFKRVTSQAFYRLMTFFGSRTIPNHADYRLLSNKALLALHQYGENALFLRGMIPELGFKSDTVYHHVYERQAGSSKYTIRKMLSLASDGIISYSEKPIYLITICGFLMMIIGLLGTVFSLIIDAASSFVALSFFAILLTGLLLTALGIIGFYVATTMFEAKKRPRYLIDEIKNDESC